jgi:hypothetical protein
MIRPIHQDMLHLPSSQESVNLRSRFRRRWRDTATCLLGILEAKRREYLKFTMDGVLILRAIRWFGCNPNGE